LETHDESTRATETKEVANFVDK